MVRILMVGPRVPGTHLTRLEAAIPFAVFLCVAGCVIAFAVVSAYVARASRRSEPPEAALVRRRRPRLFLIVAAVLSVTAFGAVLYSQRPKPPPTVQGGDRVETARLTRGVRPSPLVPGTVR